MATRGTPIPWRTLSLMQRLRGQGWSIRATARACRVSPNTVWLYTSPRSPRRRPLAA